VAGATVLRAGAKVVLLYLPDAVPGGRAYSVTDSQRSVPLLWLIALSVAAIVAFCRWRGLTSLAGLALSFAILLFSCCRPSCTASRRCWSPWSARRPSCSPRRTSPRAWLVNGVSETAGATALRNLVTGQVRTVPPTAHGSARCGPTWCRVISLDADGTAIELMRTDGAQRERIGDATMAAPLTDPTPLDRFEILAQIGDNTALTNHVQLVVYEISTRRLVLISPDAFDVNFRAGVLWWSTGTDDAFVRHALDLRTV
jgi:hypothetical protein